MRKWTETVKPWPSLKTGAYYESEVVDIKKNQKQIEVTVRVLKKEIFGRRLSFLLTLPIRPDGVIADFFKACNITVNQDVPICPKETIGKKLYIQFTESDDKVAALSFIRNKQQTQSGKEN